MKFNNRFSIVIISVVYIGFACQLSINKHRIVRKYTDNKLVKEYVVDKNDKKDGAYKEYYSNGKLKFLFNYSNDDLNGEQKAFYSNGILKKVTYYFNGQIDSVQKWYYPNNLLMIESFRLGGKKFGVQKEYYDNGKLKYLYFMADDSEMISLYKFNYSGQFVKKSGQIIYCIYNMTTLHTQDTAGAVFYFSFPPSYQYECESIVRRKGSSGERRKCDLEWINNNKGILLWKNFKKQGNYEIGVSIKLEDTISHSTLADSIFLSIKII